MSSLAHDEMLTPAERGCLLICDVSGYTSYLRDTELEHAQDVLADLTETVLRHLQPTFRLSKLEGDAAFVYALEADIEASMLLDTVEESYFAFRRRIRDIGRATSCDCNACRSIPQLDLKAVAHHGRFVRQQVGGGEELTGPDVVLVHRLLKNGVRDELDVNGYAWLTDACVRAMGIEPSTLGMSPYRETYDDVGEVGGWVVDLDERWRYEDERRRVQVVSADAEFEDTVVLPAPAPVVWELLTSPEKRPLWQGGVDGVDERRVGGRRGVGTTSHCVHGDKRIPEEILDWRPFDYFTLRRRYPVVGYWTWTFRLDETDEGDTRVTIRAQRLEGLVARALWMFTKRLLLSVVREDMQRLHDLLADREFEPATP